MTAFAVAVGTLFADRNLAMEALWRQGGAGPGQPVRVIRGSPDVTAPFGDARFVTDSDMVMVPVASVADLAPGDTFQIGAEVLVVSGEPVRDARRLIWTAQVRGS
jgi:hypothetical protein